MRRRQIFAQRFKQASLDPSGAAGLGAAVGDVPPPISREQEEAFSKIWADPLPVKPPLQIRPKRNRLSLKPKDSRP